LLKAQKIYKVYNNGYKDIAVLKGVDLNVDKGKFAVIAGPSGAGKSTLLHILGGLDSPTQGEVFFAQENIYKLSEAALGKIRNEKIGFIFQFYHLLSEFSALENVMLPALIRRRQKPKYQEVKQKASGLLCQVGLEERTTHFPSQLSGGEKQRVAIARALINEPAMLLCDEPTGNLDSNAGAEVISLIKKINNERGMTVVMVTHNSELTKFADNIYYLRDGVITN